MAAMAVALGVGASAAAAYMPAPCVGGGRLIMSSHESAVPRDLLCEINRVREARALRRVRRSRVLARAAERHAGDMAVRNYFSHVSPSGTGVLQRVQSAGYTDHGRMIVRRAGEVIGAAFTATTALTPKSLVAAWMRSPTHRKVLLRRRWRELGVGDVYFKWPPWYPIVDTAIVVVDFGWRQPARRR